MHLLRTRKEQVIERVTGVFNITDCFIDSPSNNCCSLSVILFTGVTFGWTY